MHSGDQFQLNWVPYYDPGNGGSFLAWPETLTKAAAGIKDVDTIITGHADTLMTWKDMTDHTQFMREFLAWVRAGHKAGKSVDELANAYTLPEKYKHYDHDGAKVGGFVKDTIAKIYAELKPAAGK